MPPRPLAPFSEGIAQTAEFISEHKRLALIGIGYAALGAAEGAIPIGVTLFDKHRHGAHNSLELAPWLVWLTGYERSTPRSIWVAVHQPHHEFRDVTIYPQYKIEQYLRARDADPEKYADYPEVPEIFENLDPKADFTYDEVRRIGSFAITRTMERQGDRYKEPTEFTKEEAKAILDTSFPRYYYLQGKDRVKAPYSDDDRARLLLTDPHSGDLVPPRGLSNNGIRYILRGGNVTLYKDLANLFKNEPWLIPEHVQKPGKRIPKSWPVLTALYVANISGAISVNVINTVRNNNVSREELLKDFGKGVVVGAAIGSTAIETLLIGGNITNSLGHGGELSGWRLLKSMFARNFNIKTKPDGTNTTDTRTGGILGRMVSIITGDEVGGQATHHDRPDLIAYTLATSSKQRWKEAPTGMLLEKLANSKHFKFIKPGKGFPGRSRPDIANEAVLIIEAARRRTAQERSNT